MSFEQARAKVKRANHHLIDLKERISRLENSCSALIKRYPELGYEEVVYDVTDLSATEDISLIVGDALHNLKSSLDYAWIATLKRHAPHAISDKTQFPAHGSRDALERALTDPKKGFGSNLIDFILTKVKPYPGGNDALYDIKTLNILDKHRLLLPVMKYTGFPGLEVEDERGQITPSWTMATTLAPPWHIQMPSGWHVKKKGKPSIGILFDEGTPLYFMNVDSMLEMFSVIAAQVIETLEAFV